MMAEAAMVVTGGGLAVWAGAAANRHRPGTPLLDRLAVSLLGAAGIMLALGVPMSRLPVLVDIDARLVDQGPGHAAVHVMAVKPASRVVCRYQRTDAFVVDAAGRQHEVPRSVAGDPYIGNTRPAGRHDFGVWMVRWPSDVQPVQVHFASTHTCGWWLMNTATRIGPVALQQP